MDLACQVASLDVLSGGRVRFGWEPAGFGHAYRAVEPRTSLCGKNIDGWHKWSGPFRAGAFERCPDCARIVEAVEGSTR